MASSTARLAVSLIALLATCCACAQGAPDAAASLAEALPDRNAVILIYCNNDFSGAEGPFPSKLPSASLNLPTYVALDDHGYRNVWGSGR